MLKIWGRMSSINVKKVVWTAQELGLDFQRTEAGGLFGVVTTPEYMALNPNSLVPVIEDDDYALWESNVIVRYLCAKYSSGQMYPTDLRERFDRRIRLGHQRRVALLWRGANQLPEAGPADRVQGGLLPVHPAFGVEAFAQVGGVHLP